MTVLGPDADKIIDAGLLYGLSPLESLCFGNLIETQVVFAPLVVGAVVDDVITKILEEASDNDQM